MSKAFTRESDDLPDEPVTARSSHTLPAGVKNYITPGGAFRLREQLRQIVEVDRPRLATSGDDPDISRKLKALDQQIVELEHSLQSAEVVPLQDADRDTVRFGATVTVRGRSGEETQYRIVGIDEIDIDRGWVSWLSPIAKALMNAHLGERVSFKFPAGEEELEILRISYD